jgi:ribosome biogenesis GTPase
MELSDLGFDRYRSYMKLVKESQFHEMTYKERRKKDKQFGRMIKTTLQQLKKLKPSPKSPYNRLCTHYKTRPKNS